MRTLTTLLLLAAALALGVWALWRWAPEYLPAPVRAQIDRYLAPPTASATAPHQRPLYRWRDATGQWVIADQPPTDGTPYETVVVDPRTNVLPAIADED